MEVRSSLIAESPSVACGEVPELPEAAQHFPAVNDHDCLIFSGYSCTQRQQRYMSGMPGNSTEKLSLPRYPAVTVAHRCNLPADERTMALPAQCAAAV